LTELYPYERTGAAFLATHRRAILGDAMGVGKTPQAIVAMDQIGVRSGVILTPASVRPHWERELATWACMPRQIQVVTTTSEAIEGDLVICSYATGTAPGILPQLLERDLGVLILDEVQHLKERSATRTRAVYGQHCDGVRGLIARAEYCWGLSGTIAPNHAGELWTHARAFDQTGLSHSGWLHRYCILRPGPYGPVPVATRNAEELRALLRSFYLRRRLEQVLPELPAVRTVITPIDAVSTALLEAETDPALAPLRAALERGDDAEVLHLIARASGDAIARYRHLLGLAKLPGALALLRDELEADPRFKVTVFAHHRDVLAGLVAGLEPFGVALIEGATRPADRQAALDRFASDPSCRAFVGSITAANTGVSLVASAHVTILEPDWVPATNAQAIARCRRHGQVQSVLARYLAVPHSLDEAIAGILQRKSAMLAELETAA
jgi:SWI/SNF-related matrix-associated actin-dependent regulator of chromatin subfamily A-like protein 1